MSHAYFSVALISSIDSQLSRIDTDSLPMQTQMELLVDELEAKGKFQDKDEMYLDVTAWPGLSFDSDDNVIKIWWRDHFWLQQTKGNVNFRWLPKMLRELSLTGTDFEGTVDLGNLPEPMESLYLQRNSLSGTIEFEKLSEKFLNVVLHSNKFSGTLNLSNIPPRIHYLCLHKNLFEGDVIIGVIPECLIELQIGDNKLEKVLNTDGRPFFHPRVRH